jgi:hypothetical protein
LAQQARDRDECSCPCLLASRSGFLLVARAFSFHLLRVNTRAEADLIRW